MATNLSIFSIVLSTISLLISIIIAYRNWNYSEISIRYASRNQYMTGLYELDKQMITEPKLWAVYDFHPLSELKSEESARERETRSIYIL